MKNSSKSCKPELAKLLTILPITRLHGNAYVNTDKYQELIMLLSTLNCFFEICHSKLRKLDVKSVFTSSQPNTPIDYHYSVAVTRFNSVTIADGLYPLFIFAENNSHSFSPRVQREIRNWGAGWKAVDLFSPKVRLEILFSLISPFVGM